MDSHIAPIVEGQLVTGGEMTVTRDNKVRATLITANGSVTVRRAKLVTSQGVDLLDKDPHEFDSADDEMVKEVIVNSLVTHLQEVDESLIINLAGGARLQGERASWSDNDRPSISLITGLPSALDVVKECGCALNGKGQVIYSCDEHAKDVAYEEVNAGDIQVHAGECTECGEIIKLIGYLIFEECACLRD